MADLKSLKILLIEDDSFLRELMSEKLRNAGYNVIEAADGNDGLKKIQTENPSLVLLDLILPGIDGFDLLREFRKELKIEVPIIVLSNLGNKDDIDRVMAAGANDYLIKAHFTPTDVLERMKKFFPK
ncbi:response regulator [Patescibacteria group bacterium]|nr:MAG: response regulator [Patescibacteria group bacterium]